MTHHAIATGDVLECLRELPDNSFDGLLSDPPYGFSFMGKKWDYDVPSVEVWREALRVLKPGAALLAFGGARTFHRIATAIEDAGFELRDCLTWLYGRGFPKSLDVSKALDKASGAERTIVKRAGVKSGSSPDQSCYAKGLNAGFQPRELLAPVSEAAVQWDGYGTALKPAFEPIILARKPLDGTMVQNVTRWGCGPLAIDACRIEGVEWTQEEWTAKGASRPTKNAYGEHRGSNTPVPSGRWPANLILDEDAAALLDASVAPTKSVPFGKGAKRDQDNVAHGAVLPLTTRTAGGYSDAGGPSRFFYTAKVSTKEREFGCESLPKRSAGECTERDDDTAGLESPRAGAGRGGGARNHHPTLKPLSLTKWLATLIKPPTPDACLLVPYSGAGSEIIGALQAGWPMVMGIEGEPEYCAIAEARIRAWTRNLAA